MHANRSASQNELKSIAVCITGTFLASYSDSDGRESLSDSKSTKSMPVPMICHFLTLQ